MRNAWLDELKGTSRSDILETGGVQLRWKSQRETRSFAEFLPHATCISSSQRLSEAKVSWPSCSWASELKDWPRSPSNCHRQEPKPALLEHFTPWTGSPLQPVLGKGTSGPQIQVHSFSLDSAWGFGIQAWLRCFGDIPKPEPQFPQLQNGD